MLDEGVRAAFEFYGIDLRTVCYVEREAAAAGQLVTLMEAGALDPAPIWSDVLTFRGSDWRGSVDCIIAGFPCQDLSVAGRRAGLDGKRSGLFFRVLDIADDCGAQRLFLENVSGIASATASVVDPEEGDLEERAASRVLGELADRGWNAEWITLPASDVGASHGRSRWFCYAWRVADAKRPEWWSQRATGTCDQQGENGSGREAHRGTGIPNQTLAYPGCCLAWRLEHQSRASGQQTEHQPSGTKVADTGRDDWHGQDGEGGTGRRVCQTSIAMEQPQSLGRGERWPQHAWQQGRHAVAEHGCTLANPKCPRWPQAWSGYGLNTGRKSESRRVDVADSNSARPQECGGGGGKTMNRPNSPGLAQFLENSRSSRPVLSIHDGRELSPTVRTLRPRLNPAFACWLMGWPIWWTNPGLTSSVKSEMALYRSKLQQHLCNLSGDQA